jgi:CRP-like cAMP-binding protein
MTSAPTPRDLKLVSRVGVFASIRREAVERLFAPARVVTLRKGEALFQQGDPTTGFFIVVDGTLKLCRITSSGEEAIIQLLTRGESVAAASAFVDHRYLVTAEAVGGARVIRIPMDHVLNCIRELPEIALAVIAATSQHLSQLVHHVEELKVHCGYQRVAEFLASLSPVRSGPCGFQLPYGKTVIAGRLGITPESLSRIFTKLKPAGIEVRGSQVTIREVDVLHELAADREPRASPRPDIPARKARPGEIRVRPSSATPSDHESGLLHRRLAALELDPEELSRREPNVLRELECACAACDKRGRCSRDLANDAARPIWTTYCPNAVALNALRAPAG